MRSCIYIAYPKRCSYSRVVKSAGRSDLYAYSSAKLSSHQVFLFDLYFFLWSVHKVHENRMRVSTSTSFNIRGIDFCLSRQVHAWGHNFSRKTDEPLESLLMSQWWASFDIVSCCCKCKAASAWTTTTALALSIDSWPTTILSSLRGRCVWPLSRIYWVCFKPCLFRNMWLWLWG